MATVTSYHHLIEALLTRVKVQAGELQSLADALARENEYLARKHQADLVVALQEKVMREVEWTRLAEEQASSDFTRRRKSKASAHHVVGIAQAFLLNNGRNAQRSFALARTALSRTEPFGTVAVQIAPARATPRVTVVSLSRLARQTGRSEPEVRNALATEGYHLMEPATFVAAVDELTHKVLSGAATLPVTGEQVRAYLVSYVPEANRVRLRSPSITTPEPHARLLSAGQTPPGTSGDADHPS
jgi:hypothetical protein